MPDIQPQPDPVLSSPVGSAPVLTPIRRRRWPLIIGGLFALLVLFSGVSFATATVLEDQDTFCISCHTIPETTYYNRAYIALDHPTQVVNDLATAHFHLSQTGTKTPFACIDCHRGDQSLFARVAAIALGAKDTLVYVVGHENTQIETMPSLTETDWLSNSACISCHAATLLDTSNGLNNHFHTKLPQSAALRTSSGTPAASGYNAKWSQPVDNVNLQCTNCHVAHKTVAAGSAKQFIDSQYEANACVSCHKIAHEGPQNVADLRN
jgi:hypothetical protein